MVQRQAPSYEPMPAASRASRGKVPGSSYAARVHHKDFVRLYAEAVDRMMASKAVRLDLPEDFIPAWGFLADMLKDRDKDTRDYSDIWIGKSPSQARGSDLETVKAIKKEEQARGTDLAAKSKTVQRGLDKAEYERAKKYGAKVVDVLPAGFIEG